MFVEKDFITYRGMNGIISFIGKNYLIMELPPSPGRSPAKLLVIREHYSEVVKCNEV